MPWPSWLGRRNDQEAEAAAAAAAAQAAAEAAAAEEAARRSTTLGSISNFLGIRSSSSASAGASPAPSVAWDESLNKTNWQHYAEPQAWLPPVLAVAAALGFSAFYRSYLRRIPGTNHIQPRFFRRRSLLGKVTSVGDGDNFHLFHTPGGRLAGWGWLRRVPTYRKELKGKTIPVRIAGVDAPEGAHFGRPAQPYSGEALEFLTHYLLGRRVRAYLYRRDQYDRVVARVIVRRFWFFKRDVGVEMLKRGLATCYEAKSGAEFGGRETEYRIAEAKAKARRKGMWSGSPGRANETATASSGLKAGEVETPREYKTRMATMDTASAAPKAAGAAGAVGAAPAAAATPKTPASTTTATPTTPHMPAQAPSHPPPAAGKHPHIKK
ncbi:nuclease domain containing protein [Ophiostoma piceae UAMH 11346]|uniref:Probable endonuclease LCL3 n=1 Tax=Ophiostoma piceae (strain UAMH 11346) TaxID=1262450 RepID=S3D0H4_OPHP1|nr:nuclease domain containing protein [Ophiostoma piceae UAMH 11346]